jgi:DNA polymerase III epsilon subunit-like protein
MNKKTKYLFFDIECIQVGGRDYIFSFGYVLCDPNFQIIKQEDILINPNIQFQISTGIKIHYPLNKIVSQPTFIEFYEQLKYLLENPDHQVIGHAIDNDIKFLYQECQEYKLPGFHFDFVDSQVVFDDFHHLDKRSSIATILDYYQLKPEVLHRSDMDAYYNMMYLQKMCLELQRSLDSLLSDPKILKGYSKGLICQRSLIKDWIYQPSRTENKMSLLERIDFQRFEIVTDLLLAKTFVINTKLLYDNLDVGLYLIKLILENGGSFQQSNPNPTIFIYKENDCPRQQRLQSNPKWEGSFWSVQELLKEVGVLHVDVAIQSKGYFESMLIEKENNLHGNTL